MGYKQKLIVLFSICGVVVIALIVWFCWPVNEARKKVIARNTWRSHISCYWEKGMIYLKNERTIPYVK